MINIEEAIEKFKKMAPEIVLTVDSDEVSEAVERINDRYGVDINALLIFIFTGDLDRGGLVDFAIREFQLDKEKAEQLKGDIDVELIAPIIKRLNFLDANFAKTSISKKEIKDILLDIFRDSCVDELSKDIIILTAINLQVFFVLKDDLEFQKKLVKVFYENEEVITRKIFLLDKRRVTPNISNWIKDFIKSQGSIMFDSITLIKYMTSSENVKKLDESEKTIVKKVLLTYRNIKYFPESMASDHVEDWEIFPIYEEGGDSRFLDDKKTEEELVIDELKEKQKEYKKGTLESEVIEEEISNEKEIEGLKIVLEKYEKGTLEYSAILEEIKKKSIH